jgi:hypothetical protein
MLAVTLHKNAEQFLEHLAHDRGKTPETVASETLEEWLENQALLRLAEERKAEWEASGRKTYTLDEIEAMYGLQDEV